VVVDGEVGPSVDRVARVIATADHVAWVARVGDHDVLALDDKPVAVAPSLRTDAVTLSPAGLAYVETVEGGERVVAAGRPGKTYDDVGAPAWSPDGRIGYAARKGRSQMMVIGERELPGGDWVGSPVWSGDGRRLGYVVRRGRKQLVIVDGRELAFDLVFVDSLTFSHDGTRWAIIAGDLRREQLYFAVEGRDRVPLHATEIYSAAASNDTEALLAWSRAEVER
jgi:hypothetical protein